MLTPHMLVGAAIAKGVGRPWLAYPSAFASHFVLDSVPHTDQHALFGATGGGVTTGEIVASAADLLVAVTSLVFLIGMGRGDWLSRCSIGGACPPFLLWGGALFGALIDILDNVPLWNQAFRSLPGMASLSRFHHHLQHNLPASHWPLGMGTQLAVSLAAAWLLFKGP